MVLARRQPVLAPTGPLRPGPRGRSGPRDPDGRGAAHRRLGRGTADLLLRGAAHVGAGPGQGGGLPRRRLLERLALGLASLLDTIPSATLDRVPVADRITAWLCAQNERAATEEYLEYAFDNRNGFPFGLSDGRPRITLPFIDALSTAPRGLTLAADADMRFRARLTRAKWMSEKVLRLEGAAFMEYLDDRCGESVIELVLTEHETGRKVRVPAEQCEGVLVNLWSTRANEDHTGSGFAAEIDVTTLGTDSTSYEVWVDLRLAGFHRVGPFRSRNGAASPGLLEISQVDGTSYEPVWHEHRGLSLRVDLPREGPRRRSGPGRRRHRHGKGQHLLRRGRVGGGRLDLDGRPSRRHPSRCRRCAKVRASRRS